jgi:hypothetical protein
MLVLSWLGFVATVVLRPNPGAFNAWLDAGVYNIPFAAAMVACVARASRDPMRRHAWRSLAAGLVLDVAGNFYGSLVVGDRDVYPSPADARWLSFYVLMYVAIIQFVRSGATEFQLSVWLDGAVAGIGAAALVVAFALRRVLAEPQVASADDATALARRAIATLDEPFTLDGIGVRVGASVGIALFPLHADRRSERAGMMFDLTHTVLDQAIAFHRTLRNTIRS